jgi:hypothetical protein
MSGNTSNPSRLLFSLDVWALIAAAVLALAVKFSLLPGIPW